MPDFRKKLPKPITTGDGIVLTSIASAMDYAHLRNTPPWNWARRHLTRAALSDDPADMTAAIEAVRGAVMMDGLRRWSGRSRAQRAS